jgi:hypothetical protein
VRSEAEYKSFAMKGKTRFAFSFRKDRALPVDAAAGHSVGHSVRPCGAALLTSGHGSKSISDSVTSQTNT